MANDAAFSVSEFLDYVNQTLDYAYPSVIIVGEVSSFKINQGKWAFFSLKDEYSSVSCFLPAWELRTPIEDGMKIMVQGFPKLTKLGRFSFTVKKIRPVGEGSIKKSFELLKKKLDAEGLFAPEKKRPLPKIIKKIGVISSMQAAGYADFVKIVNERWGGLELQVAHTGVQGLSAADQIIRALKYLNEHGEVEVIAIIRGGGSADDLAVFNDEKLVREIASSKIPVITGIGHEVDESLSDLAADIRASTPSNAAQMLTPDRRAEIARIHTLVSRLTPNLIEKLRAAYRETLVSATLKNLLLDKISSLIIKTDFTPIRSRLLNEIISFENSASDAVAKTSRQLSFRLTSALEDIDSKIKLLSRLNPEIVLKQGYAILSGEISVGKTLAITTEKHSIDAKITKIKERN